MKHLFHIFCLNLIILITIVSCSQSNNSTDEVVNGPDSLIYLSKKQFDTEGMEIGEVQKVIFEDIIECNGFVVPDQNGVALVSSPMSGFIASVNCTLGQYVHKGQNLCRLKSHELIEIQQQFVDAAASMNYLEKEYKRVLSLFKQQIVAEKEFIALESDYKKNKARYNALKFKLSELKLDLTKIENGDLFETFSISAPIEGYITKHNFVLGQYNEQQKVLVEIIDKSRLMLRLSVYESDVPKLEEGMKVRFFPLEGSDKNYMATIKTIVQAIEPDTKTVQCIALPDNESKIDFINQSFVTANIIVSHDLVNALPNEAVFHDDNRNFIYEVVSSDNEKVVLNKKYLSTGKISNEFTSVLEPEKFGKILTKGGYNLAID